MDATYVNFSGRQRMLSQKLTKTILQLYQTQDSLERLKLSSTLYDDYQLFENTHHALLEGNLIGEETSDYNSEGIKKLFVEITPHFEGIKEEILKLKESEMAILDDSLNRKKLLEEILTNESVFLKLMDEITFQYSEESEQKVKSTSKLEYTLYAVALLLLLLEALIIFRPALSKLKKSLTELIDKEKELAVAKVQNNYVKKLEKKNEQLETFTYITSHDLQEPLKNILGLSDILEKSYKNQFDQDGQKIISFIHESAKHSSRMIKDLLIFSQLGDKKDLEEVDCNEVIQEILDTLHVTVEEHEATITTEKLPTLKAQRSEVRALFQNLIHNGIKYRKKETPPAIQIKYGRSDGYHHFIVLDNGMGIDKVHFEKIFAIFQRLNTEDDIPGSGIGLAICKKIVESYEGKIWLESQKGKGTSFFINLPF